MKKTMGLAVLAGAATFASAGPASAEVTANVALTTDYVFRGVSQTDNGAAIQGGFDWTGDLFYAGVWASNVNFGAVSETETVSMELDAYVGIRPTTGPVTWDLSLVGYFYPNGDDSVVGGELDYFEGIVGAEIELFDPFTLGGQLAYSPENLGETGDALYAEINGRFEFNDAFHVSGAFGNQDDETLGDYDTWNIGAAFAMHGFTFDLRYHDTDLDDVDEIVNFTISREL